jgi:hypothetical protein
LSSAAAKLAKYSRSLGWVRLQGLGGGATIRRSMRRRTKTCHAVRRRACAEGGVRFPPRTKRRGMCPPISLVLCGCSDGVRVG